MRTLLSCAFCVLALILGSSAASAGTQAPFPKGEFKELWEPQKVMPLIRKNFTEPCKKEVGCGKAFVTTSTGEPGDPTAPLGLMPGESAFRFMYITYPHKPPAIILEYRMLSLDEAMIPSSDFYFEDQGANGDFDVFQVTYVYSGAEAACWSRKTPSPCQHARVVPSMLEKATEMYHSTLTALSRAEFVPAQKP